MARNVLSNVVGVQIKALDFSLHFMRSIIDYNVLYIMSTLKSGTKCTRKRAFPGIFPQSFRKIEEAVLKIFSFW